MTLAADFHWLASDAATISLLIATCLEVGAYYVPWLDNLLDGAAAPAAIVAGTIMTGAMVGEMSPLLKWSLAVIAGGGTAAAVQAVTTVVRGSSTLSTGGIANPVVSTGELVGASTLTISAIFIPLIAIFLFMGLMLYIGLRIARSKIDPVEKILLMEE